jgi:hypothetical protein
MRYLLALTPLFLIATALPAQTGSATMEGLMAQSSPATVTVLTSQPVNNCPIGIAAEHTPQGGMQEVSPSAKHHQLGYNISLSAFDGRLIRQADVTLHGIIGAHFMPTKPNAHGTDSTETFTLTQSSTPRPTFQSVVYANKLTGVSWIQVDEVTYADGTEWHQTAGSVCRVAPNGVILINATSKSLNPRP